MDTEGRSGTAAQLVTRDLWTLAILRGISVFTLGRSHMNARSVARGSLSQHTSRNMSTHSISYINYRLVVNAVYTDGWFLLPPPSPVCLSVGLFACQQDYAKPTWPIFMKVCSMGQGRAHEILERIQIKGQIQGFLTFFNIAR